MTKEMSDLNMQICPLCQAQFVGQQWVNGLGKVSDPAILKSRACYYASQKGKTGCINTATHDDDLMFKEPPTMREMNAYVQGKMGNDLNEEELGQVFDANKIAKELRNELED